MAQITRQAVPEELTWDLASIFASDDNFELAFQAVVQAAEALQQYQGQVGTSATSLVTALQADLKLERQFEKVFVYAHQKYDQDTTNDQYAALNARVQSLYAQVSQATAFIQPEILAIPNEKLDQYLANPVLKPYQHFLAVILQQKKHTLPADQEALLAGASDIFNASQQTFGALDNADIEFGTVTDENGQEVELTNGLYSILLQSQQGSVRQEAFDQLYDAYIGLKNTFASTLSANVKTHNFLAKTRHYQSARQAAVTPNQIPEEVYDTLTHSVNEHLPLLHRFVALRKQVLKLNDVHPYDLYVPLVEEIDYKVTYQEAQEIAVKALAPLGEDYIAIVKKAFAQRWIDVVENKGKRSGAYSGGSYDTHPYILLNWQDTLDNVYTLVHEMGHSVHSYLTRHNQPYHYGDYPIFLAEIASTTNESLLTDYLLQTHTEPKFRAYVLNQYLDGFKGTVFRQTQFAEFEQWLHEQDAAGRALTADVMSEYYGQLNQKFYGPDLFPDEQIAYEWARIPHFYYNFYVYQYATGEAAATTLSDKILNQNGASAYKTYLKAGSSANPLDVIQAAGVDMRSSAYLDQAFELFEARLTELETLLTR
ncbi:oligoendopeptidase F [Convivina praedatoris]|uniref:Oligopeptidase F n=1 Tax=Convivina praedatoris TaxID=2880963 RepID=A0ABM9D101_9LACO|nr:oligoendopeptidase F [Convivina sp. LMG 32447]CAH1852540.1 Oligoendopeptidase F, plasmid [Convivina sp. LMG 32447]CAH1852576.1 Oligoendopeptidase F, plasmid [Convivina sp. LMG 32447]CAH1855010.1 Oligoendopeptidase F, plasmid [Convivina sp. LMG 32447]